MKAVFLDTDGTLIDDIAYNVEPRRIALCQGAGPALRLQSGLGYRLFVVSNQDGIGDGRCAEAAMRPLAARLAGLLAREQAALAGFYYCPHHPRAALPRYARACNCRKPAPGMLLRAAREHGIDLSASWMIGDILMTSKRATAPAAAASCSTQATTMGGWATARACRPWWRPTCIAPPC